MTITSIAAALTLAATPAAPGGSAASSVAELPLDAALAELDRQNLTLVQARSRADEAAGVVRQSASALLPSVTAAGSFTRNNQEAKVAVGDLIPGAPRITPLIIQPGAAFNVSGALRVPLVVPNAWYDLAAARDAARAAELSASAVRLSVRAGFAQAAYAAAGGEEVVAASELAAASAAELTRSAERRVAAGTAAPLDVLRARTEQVRRESDVVGARADLGRARLALGILLGRATPARVLVPREGADAGAAGRAAPDAAAGASEALLREAFALRPELAAQDAQADAAQAELRSAWARLAPQLSTSASAFASDVPYVTGSKQGWRFTVDLTWTLFDGGFRYGKRKQAEAALAGARAASDAQRLQVAQEVQDGVRDVAVAEERLRLAETQRQLATDAAASAKRSFDAGIASSLDVIDANDRRYLADIGLADARARLAQARVALEHAVGRAP